MFCLQLVLDSHVQLGELVLTEEGYADSAVHLDILQLVLERFDTSSAIELKCTSRSLLFLVRALVANDRALDDGRSLQSIALAQV